MRAFPGTQLWRLRVRMAHHLGVLDADALEIEQNEQVLDGEQTLRNLNIKDRDVVQARACRSANAAVCNPCTGPLTAADGKKTFFFGLWAHPASQQQ